MELKNSCAFVMKRNVRKRASEKDAKHDIFEIHDRTMNFFQREYESLNNLKKQKNAANWIISNGELSEQHAAMVKVEKLTEQIYLIESGIREAQYIHKTENILKEYEEIMQKPIKIDFNSGRTSNDEIRKKDLLIEFVNIAREYIDVEPITVRKQMLICNNCNVELLQRDDLLFICEKCGYSERALAAVTNYQDNSRINSSQRYVYEKRANFLNSIKEFQGIQNTTVPENVRADLDDQITSHDITKDRLTKDHIYEFLKITDHTDYYKDINMLYTEITEKPSPNISNLVTPLLQMFDMALPVFERVKSPERLNFLNGQFVLFKFLQLLGFNCSEDNFYILKTREKILEHDEKWKIICDELEWPYMATV
jgi:hypothetical protein